MIAAAVVIPLLMAAACLGAGAAVLVVLRLFDDLPAGEQVTWSFAVGFGTLGWLLFPMAYAGWLDDSNLGLLLVVCAAGVVSFRHSRWTTAAGRPGTVGWLLIAGLVVAFGLDLIEALAPPADADSLAYHFALPKQFLAAGHLFFVPRAVDGAAPMIVQMTYLPALALGGESALTLWTCLTGWMVGALVYAVGRRFLGRDAALAMTLVLMTTPAVVYGAGNGQVETRLALFAVVAAVAVSEAMRRGRWDYAALAGLTAGFYAGGKYTGLLMVAACGLVILLQRRWFTHGLAFGLAALAGGFQWYAWHWLNTGDPVFPMLYGWLGTNANGYWNDATDTAFHALFRNGELGVPRNLLWFLVYPFAATLDPMPAFEAGRVGFGPIGLLLLPFAVAGLWQYRGSLPRARLTPVAAILLIYYALWFFTGASQRVRHLLPLYPLLLICVSAAAWRWTDTAPRRWPLAAALLLTIGLQMAGQGVFSLNYVRHLANGEGRTGFYQRNVPQAVVAGWINEHLAASDRVLHIQRPLSYLLDVPEFRAPSTYQAKVDLAAAVADTASTWRQLRDLGITHILATVAPDGTTPAGVARLIDVGCATSVRRFHTTQLASRTLPTMSTSPLILGLFDLTPTTCQLQKAR